MPVAIHLGRGSITDVLETYDLLSHGLYIHATPTLLNAGRPHAQLSSCFLYPADVSTLRSTFQGIHNAAQIFTYDGGLGLGLQSVPAKR